MNKTKKPRNKRYTPRRDISDRHIKAMAHVMWTADARRLTDIQQIEVLLKMDSAYAESRREYSPGAFNVLGHIYRLCKGIAEGMDMPGFAAICDDARLALQEYYDSDGREPIPDRLAARIEPMLESFRFLLPDLPLGVYEKSYEISRTILIEKALEQFDSLPPEYSEVALAVMGGEKVPSIAERTGQPESEISVQARVVAALVYTIKGDQSKDFPTTIDRIRKQGEELSRALMALQEVKRVVKEHCEAEQARKAAA